MVGYIAAENDFSSYRFPVHLDSYDYRAICLFFACLVYGIWGSPTPDQLGLAEVLVGALLALSIGVGRGRDALMRPVLKRFWKSAGQVFLLYGLSVPVLVAAARGYAPSEIMRDIFPFLFLFLPLFLLPLIRGKPYYYRSIFFGILFIGFVFSLRSLVMRYDHSCALWCTEELLYLENMPSVLLTALVLIGGGMHVLSRGFTVKRVIVFSVLLALSLLPLAAMVVTLQRASIGAVVLYVCALFCFYLFRRPAGGVCVLLGLTGVALIFNFSFSSVLEPLWVKTDKVGLNMRPQEFMAVWDVMTRDIWTFLFGLGWGGQFQSPAVGDLRVNFTHNFFSSIFLKTGAVGVVFCIAYIAGLLERLSRVIIKNSVIGLALAAPILIDLTLYASFKSLDFGLVLLLISGSLVYFRQFESLSEHKGVHA